MNERTREIIRTVMKHPSMGDSMPKAIAMIIEVSIFACALWMMFFLSTLLHEGHQEPQEQIVRHQSERSIPWNTGSRI